MSLSPPRKPITRDPGGRTLLRGVITALLLASGVARAEGAPSVFLSVGGRLEAADRDRLCGVLKETLTLTGRTAEGCVRLDVPAGRQVLEQARSTGQHPLHVSVEGQRTGDLELRIERWSGTGLETPAQVIWMLRAAPAEQLHEQVRRKLREVLAAHEREEAYNGLDPRRMAELAAGRLYEPGGPTRAFRNEKPPPSYLGAALDIGIILGVSTIQYVNDPSTNAQDWTLDYSWRTLGRKLTFQEVYLDDNYFRLNSGHAVSGTYYYLVSRVRHLSWGESLTAAALGATAWEMFSEFRELVSLNDLVITSLSGLALGEALYQLSTFFRLSAPNGLNMFLGDLLGGPGSLIWARDHSVPGGLRLVDERGFTMEMWRRFHLFAGADVMSGANPARATGGAGVLLGVDAELIPRVDYDRPGATAEWLTEPFHTRLRGRLSMGEGWVREAWLLAQSEYAGYYFQRLRRDEGGLWGLQGYAALGALLEHEERRVAPSTDAITAMSPVGPVLHLSWHAGALRLRGSAQWYPVFGQTLALGLRAYGGDLTAAQGATQEHGYYHSVGTRPAFSLGLEYRGLDTGLEYRGYDFLSLQDAFTPRAYEGPRFADQRRIWSAWLGHQLPVKSLRLGLGLERGRRSGQAGDARQTNEESRALLRLDWRL